MTKTTTKSADAAGSKVLIALGYDEDQKPRGARLFFDCLLLMCLVGHPQFKHPHESGD